MTHNQNGDTIIRKEITTLNVKKLREEKRLSQVQLARICNMAQSSISYIESGEKSPSLNTLQILAKAFDLSIAELIDS